MVVKIVGVGATGIQWVAARDAAKDPVIHPFNTSSHDQPLLLTYTDRQTDSRAGGPELTLVGCLPLTVLGICLIQVGEAGPQLQDAM